MKNPLFIFIHGAVHQGKCWQHLIPFLPYPSLCPDLPGRGENPAELQNIDITDWSNSIASLVAQHQDHDVILVGHSLAGITVPRAAAIHPDIIKHMVFVACSIPPQGMSVLGELGEDIQKLAEDARENKVPNNIDDTLAIEMFCNDMSEQQTKFTLDQLVAEAWGPLLSPNDLAGFEKGIPVTYIKLLQDQALTPDLQDNMIRNIPKATVVELDAGHNIMISQPEMLADVLNPIAAQ